MAGLGEGAVARWRAARGPTRPGADDTTAGV